MPVYSSFPETTYALALTKPRMYSSQRRLMDMVCGLAQAQDVVAGEILMSDRGIASRLRISPGNARELRDALLDRKVLRKLHTGAGHAPTCYRVWHWSQWDRNWWAMPWEAAAERLYAFAAGEIRARAGSSARLLVRALGESAQDFSRQLEELARGRGAARKEIHSDPGDRGRGFGTRALGGRPIYFLPEFTPAAGTLGEEEELIQLSPGEERLVQPFMRRHGLRKLWGDPIGRLCNLVATANGSLEAVIEEASSPMAHALWMQHLKDLEAIGGGKKPLALISEPNRRPTREDSIRSSLRAMELMGEEPDPDLLAELNG